MMIDVVQDEKKLSFKRFSYLDDLRDFVNNEKICKDDIQSINYAKSSIDDWFLIYWTKKD